jgi:hypothetical protein
MVNEGLRHGGIHLVSDKGHGKTRLLFSIADYCRTLENSRVIIFDGSDSWLYGFSQIPVFNVNNEDISANSQKYSFETEHYSLNNWNLVKLALDNHQDILFRLKTRSPSRRGFFIRSVVNHLDNIQREQIELSPTNQPKNQIAYFIEESQDAFNSRTTARTESETFLTVFNEARNQREAFFTASQRLSDFSKTIRTKQSYLIGRINMEDINPQIHRYEKLYNVNLAETPLRSWYFKGEMMVSPTWTQDKKPYIINQEIRKQYQQPTNYKLIPATNKKPNLLKRIFNALTTQSNNDQTEQNIKEDSKGDFLMLDDDELMFSES